MIVVFDGLLSRIGIVWLS